MVNSIANQLPEEVLFEKDLGRLSNWYRVMRQGGLKMETALQMPITDVEMRERLIRFWNSGGYEPSTDQKVARAILGEGNFFGPAEWLSLFGNGIRFSKSQLGKIANLPWSEDKIRKPGLGQPEFVFLGAEKLNGEAINLPLLHKIYGGSEYPKFYLDWYLNHVFAQGTAQFRWYSITVGVVEYSWSKWFAEQEAMLPPEYEVPSVPELVLGNVLYCLLNSGKYLTEGIWSSTKNKAGEKEESGVRVGVQGFPDRGLHVRRWPDAPRSYVGVAASKKVL